MKKLMITLASAMIGIAANAASAEWMVFDVAAKAEGADIDASGIYAFDTKNLAQDAFIAMYAEGDTSWTTSATAGSYDEGMAWGEITGYGNLEQANVWFAIFDTEGNVLVSDVGTATTGGAGQSASPDIAFDTTAGIFDAKTTNYSASGSGWYTAAPEPTSGLLLLLGVAGLALRRRRA